MAYIAYHIWLSRNSLVFDAKVVLVPRLLERATCLATKYSCFDTASTILNGLDSWGFHSTTVATWRVFLIFWHPPSP